MLFVVREKHQRLDYLLSVHTVAPCPLVETCERVMEFKT